MYGIKRNSNKYFKITFEMNISYSHHESAMRNKKKFLILNVSFSLFFL